MKTLFIGLLSASLVLNLFSTTASATNSLVAWGAAPGTNYPAGLGDVKAIAAGEDYSVALLANGSLTAWGNSANNRTIVPADLTNAVAIAAGKRHGLAIRADGTVVAWGQNSHGKTSVPAGLSNVIAVAAGEEHSLALRRDGTVASWGEYYDTSSPTYYSPMNIGAGLTNVAAISAGYNHDLMLLSNGLVVADGYDGEGQTDPPPWDLTNIVAIAAGGDMNLALTRSGHLNCWGKNGGLSIPDGPTDVIAIAAGYNHDLALYQGGIVRCWGDETSGQTRTPLGLSNVVAIAGGAHHSLALVSNQTALAFSIVCPTNQLLTVDAGHCSASNVTFVVTATNGFGEISINSVPPSGSTFPVGVTTVTSTATDGRGSNALCAFTVTVVDNEPPVVIPPTNRIMTADPGQCSRSNVTFSVGASDCTLASVVSVPPDGGTFALGTTIVTNTATDAFGNKSTCTFTVTVIKSEPPVITCPTNLVLTADPGQCGKSNVTFLVTATDDCGSVYVVSTPPSGSTFPVGATTVNSRATNSQGNTANCTFTVTIVDTEPPVIVRPADMRLTAEPGQHSKSNVTFEVAATDNCGSPSLVSVPPSGSFFPVGTTLVTNTATDSHGNSTTSTFAVTVVEPPNTLLVAWGSGLGTNCPPDIGDVKAIAAGENFSVALLADGTVTAWGDSQEGRTGVPPGLSNVVAIAAGKRHALALRADGTVAAWGRNARGQSQVPTGLSNVVAIAGGEEHSLALRKDGTVVCWGTYWDAGDQQEVTLDIGAGLTNVAAISAGYNHDLMLLSNGIVVARGLLEAGQTNVPDGLTDVVAIATGGNANVVETRSDQLVTWGPGTEQVLVVAAAVTNVAVTNVSVGSSHGLALRRDGSVRAWGNNDFGQTTVPAGLSNVVAIAAGHQHSLALVNNAVAVAVAPPFSILTPHRISGTFSVSVPTVQGRSYRLEYKHSLSDPDWTPLDSIPGDGTAKTLTDTPTAGQRFYRVKQF